MGDFDPTFLWWGLAIVAVVVGGGSLMQMKVKRPCSSKCGKVEDN
jgi:hypothetical protein